MVEAKDQSPGNMTDGDPALLEQERNPREGGKKQECGVREVRTSDWGKCQLQQRAQESVRMATGPRRKPRHGSHATASKLKKTWTNEPLRRSSGEGKAGHSGRRGKPGTGGD